MDDLSQPRQTKSKNGINGFGFSAPGVQLEEAGTIGLPWQHKIKAIELDFDCKSDPLRSGTR